MIDLVPKRKGMEEIKLEVNEIKKRNAGYRPAHTRLRGDSEKDRLSQVFTHKGGSCLPNELTNPVSEAPFERMARMKKVQQMESRSSGPKSLNVQGNVSHKENTANMLSSEIDERMDHIEAMKSLKSLTITEENRLKSEIAVRVQELQKLDGLS